MNSNNCEFQYYIIKLKEKIQHVKYILQILVRGTNK